MKSSLAILLVWLFTWNPISTFINTRNINNANEIASENYVNHKFEDAVNEYDKLLNELNDKSPYTKYHLAISNYHKGDTAVAKIIFQEALQNNIDHVTVADIHFRLGNIYLSQNVEESIKSYKKALRSYGDHLHAKLNLELALRLKQQKQQQQKQQQQQQQNKDDKNNKDKKQKDKQQQKQQNKDDKNKDDKNKDDKNKKEEEQKKKEQQQKKQQQQKENEEKKSEQQKEREKREKLKKKLKEIKMTPEKAKQVLEAMKNKEIQYIQNIRKQSKNKNDKSKPDW